MSQTVLILGGTSDIARAIARNYAAKGARITLTARDVAAVKNDLTDLLARGAASANALPLDVLDEKSCAALLTEFSAPPEVIVCAVGLLGDQKAAELDAALAETVMRSNYLAPALLLGEFANRMELRGSGTIIGISSVAGDRGRASNYMYGSAKAGFTAFLSGLRNRLARRGVNVVTVKPGFVATRMTASMNLPKLLTAQPAEVAAIIERAVARGATIIYAYPIWRYIMLAIAHIPECMFKKMKL